MFIMLSGLVSYSDSDEDKSDESNGSHISNNSDERGVKRSHSQEVNLEAKKVKQSAGILPLPDTIKSLFADKSRHHQDDPEKHGGRIRSFAHEEGSWATHVHIPYDHDSRFENLVQELLLCLRPLDFKPIESFHISLSRTVSLRHHWIKSLTDSLQAKARILHKCYCEMVAVKLYTNDEKNRTFVAVEVQSHPDVLRDYILAVDTCLEEFGLQKYYKDPSFHLSVGWCVGDVLPDVLEEQRHQLQAVLDRHLHTHSDLKLIHVDQIKCKSEMAKTLWLLLLCCLAVYAREITLQTYNVGLNPRVENMDIRRDAVVPELRQNGSDVVCLQEIWRSGDVQHIIESLKDIYPYSLSPLHDQMGNFHYRTFWPPCFSWAAMSFATCALTYCRNEPTEEDVVRCVVSCGFVDVSRECISCVVIGGTFAALRGCVYGFGYNYNPQGLLLLSKRPLYDGSITDYFPGTKTIAQRSYVKAEVENFGPVVCTHMTSYLGEFYLEPSLMDRFRGWADQSQYEASVLISLFNRDRKGVIMGDLNTSPGLPRRGVFPHMAASYNEFLYGHWSSPFVDNVGACTFCKDNVLTFDNESWILDHVLTKGHNVIDSRLLHTANINGQNFPVSDHYGVEVTFDDEI